MDDVGRYPVSDAFFGRVALIYAKQLGAPVSPSKFGYRRSSICRPGAKHAKMGSIG